VQGPAGHTSVSLPSTHAPAWHVSPVVQALSSSHAVPSGMAGFEQAPVPAWHVPATWHWSSGVHAATVQQTPSTQEPDPHTSAVAQGSPSATPRWKG
jgi:hypothetical protein